MGLEFLGLGFAIGIGTFGEAYVVKSVIESVTRQPEISNTLRTFMIIGVALVETGIIYSFILGILLWIKM
ncbi:MAG: hypothetical protein FD141_1084 [Fusobacteria bacterium]|nr:MAG: hypothetical protein FD141_1084 [Fusobacteriota bacterium]KAF0229797.1 MAG: hypothetical protein FD182_187 [Fusobacteriota bacterium]